MIPVLSYIVVGLSVIGGIWGLITTARNYAPGRRQLIFAAVAELGVVVQSIIGFVRIGPLHPAEVGTTIGYLIAVIVLVPVAWVWANLERTRWSGLVLFVAFVAVIAMTLRLLFFLLPG